MSSMEDPVETEKLRANIKFRRAQSVRKVIKVFLISVPFISILSKSSWIPPCPPSLSFTQILQGFHLTTLLQSIASCIWNTDREILFLLCNVILMFLIMDSGLVCISPSANDQDQFEIHDRFGLVEFRSGAIVVLDEDDDEEEEGELEEYLECLELVVVDEAAKEVSDEVPDEIMDKLYDDFIQRFKRERRMEELQLVVV